MNRFLAIFLSVFLIMGCSSTSETGIIRYDMTSPVSSVDPQTATSEGNLLVIANIYEGLTKLSPSGEIVGGAAERWEVSGDELTFTFHLKENLKWSDGSDLLAEDFVFALRRLVSPITNSPFATKYYSLKNAKSIHTELAPSDTLGVYAPNKTTVVIELEYKDPRIPTLLSESPAMPCDEEYFNKQKGKYGLTGKNTLSNSNLLISSWGSEIITLTPNKHHSNPAQYNKLYLCFGRGDPTEVFLAQRSEVCIIPYQNIELAQDIDGIPILAQSWFLSINPNSFIGSNESLRAAFIGAISNDHVVTRFPKNVSVSKGLIPPIATISGQSYRNVAGSTSAKTVNNPRTLFSSTLASLNLEILPKSTLYVSSLEPGPLIGGVFQKEWNDTLSAHINMEPLSYDDLLSRYANNSYDMAILPSIAFGSHPENFFSPFSNYEIEIDGLKTTVARELEKIRNVANVTLASQRYREIEQALIDNSYLLPLYDTPSLLVMSPNVSGVTFDVANSIINFGSATISEQ